MNNDIFTKQISSLVDGINNKLRKLLSYVGNQVYIDNLIINKNVRNLTSSLSSNKAVLAIVEQEDHHDVVRTYIRTLDCRNENDISVCYEAGPSFETDNELTYVESTPVAVDSYGNFIAFRSNNTVHLHQTRLTEYSHVCSFPINRLSDSDPLFNRSIEFIKDVFDDRELLLIHKGADSLLMIKNYTSCNISEMIFTYHKLYRGRALFYRLLHKILFRIC